MSNAVKHLYKFGPYRMDPAERLLLRGSERLDLPPRVFDTLLVLVENEQRLLEKSELMDRVWPGTVVEENNLTQAIYLLRKTLQDGEPENLRYIETIPKRGYRFVAEVRRISENVNGNSHLRSAAVSAEFLEPAEIPMPSNAIEPRSRSKSHNRWWITTAILVIALAAGAWRWYESQSGNAFAPIRSIAVLPLQNLSNDQNQEYFADGMTDQLITDLAQIRELKVVSKTSVMQYKGTLKSLPQIGRELGVDAVVEGSVLRSGDQVRITAQLIRASNDRHLWAQSYEGEMRNLLALQAHVAEAITTEVRLKLDSQEIEQLRTAKSYDPEAYDLYLRGRYAFRRRNLESLHEAKGYFEQAAARDPGFPLAYAGLADTYTLLALFGDGYSWVTEAVQNARHAIALDETLAEPHTSLGAALVLDWKWDEAEKEFRRAIELNHNDVQAHHWYGNLLLGPEGRHSEAIAELQRALDLDPLSLVINTDLGFGYYLDGRMDAALQQYQKVLATDPTFLPVHFYLMLYYRQQGMYADQMKELMTDMILDGHADRADFIRRNMNDPERLNRMVAETGGAFAGDGAGSPVASAHAYLAIGKKDLALAALRKAVAARETDMIYLKVDPAWAPLRAEPEFQELLRIVGLADTR